MRQGGESERGWEVVKAPSVVEHGLELSTFVDCGCVTGREIEVQATGSRGGKILGL